MYNYISKNLTLLLRLIILLILIWISFGYFPILNIEGDSAFFNAGCERLYTNGFKLPPDYFYEWDMQPLVGVIVVVFKFLNPILNCEHIYSVLTIVCSISFLFVASIFVSNLSKLRWEYCFIALILLPESYVIAYYSNTTIFASLAAFVGFLLLIKKPMNTLSIILLGIAPLLRVDIVTIYPFILLLFWQKFNFKKSFLYTSIYAISTITISFVGFYILEANPLRILILYDSLKAENSATFNLLDFLKINVSFYSIASIFLIILGIINLYFTKQYKLLAMQILPIATLYFIYTDFTGTATKHLYYIIPFVTVIVIFGVYEIINNSLKTKYLFIFIIASSIIFQSVVGIRLYANNMPWLLKSYCQQYSQPTILTLFEKTIKQSGQLKIVIGAGQVIPTADELMLLSGHLFAPFYWHTLKKMEFEERKQIEDFISNQSYPLHFIVTQSSEWFFSQQLHNLGFNIETIQYVNIGSDFYYKFIFKKGIKKIILNSFDINRGENSFNKAFTIIEHRPLYVITNWDWQLYMINENMTQSQAITTKLSVCK